MVVMSVCSQSNVQGAAITNIVQTLGEPEVHKFRFHATVLVL